MDSRPSRAACWRDTSIFSEAPTRRPGSDLREAPHHRLDHVRTRGLRDGEVDAARDPRPNRPRRSNAQPIGGPQGASNVLDAVVVGATDGLKLALNVGAMLVAFIAILALLDWPLGALSETEWIAGWRATNGYGTWSVQGGLGLLFQPIAWCIGAPSRGHSADRPPAWNLHGRDGVRRVRRPPHDDGRRHDLAPWRHRRHLRPCAGSRTFPRWRFRSAGSAPSRRSRRADFSSLAPRAMLAGALACWSTAAIASAII